MIVFYFCGQFPIHVQYDLKGSRIARKVGEENMSPDSAGKDLDFLEYQVGLWQNRVERGFRFFRVVIDSFLLSLSFLFPRKKSVLDLS